MAFIKASNLSKIYQSGEVEVKALDNTSFEINEGELVCVLGPSGAGKTTCLNILGGMDEATTGELFVDDIDITKLNRKELIEYRRDKIGFVFQFYNLVQNLTALENVELAVQLCANHLDPKEIMKKAGVPVIPGSDGSVGGIKTAKEICEKIGYPVILKAASGGGGKGIRIVEREQDLENAYNIVKQEAKVSFNDDEIYIEKFIKNPRHVEIQILADEHGNVVHLGERDCSIQRRHQKTHRLRT